MTTRTRNTAVALVAALGAASTAYALGTQAGDGSAAAAGTSTPAREHAWRMHGFRQGADGSAGLAALASKLGVTPARLRAAIEGARADVGAGREQRREDMAAKLASALGVPVAKVRAALPSRGPGADFKAGLAAALAKQLGIETAKVQAAFDKLRATPPSSRGTRADRAAALAQALGVTPAKLKAALANLRASFGRGHGPSKGAAPSLAPLAGKLGVTPAKLQTALDKLRADERAQRQAQRDAFVAALAKRLDLPTAKVADAVGALPFGGGRGRHGMGGRHGYRGFHGGQGAAGAPAGTPGQTI